MITTPATDVPPLPGLDCGLCGMRTCDDLARRLPERPELLERCIPLTSAGASPARREPVALPTRGPATGPLAAPRAEGSPDRWLDTLGREFDFFLEHFPEEPGPREVMLPHNPLTARELDLVPGDLILGRPLGMSCGCPITHCGVVTEVDRKTGVVVWCVTGPLGARAGGAKDIGYYSAQAYEGLVTESKVAIEIGRRYFFQPRLCMLQWRHSGLVNYVSSGRDGIQVRVEGLWIG